MLCFCEKGSLQHQYGNVPSGAFTAPSSHGRPNMNAGNLPNGGDLFGSYPWGYYPSNHPSGGYQDQRFGYGLNSSSNTYSHLMVCWFCFITPFTISHLYFYGCIMYLLLLQNPNSSQEALSYDQFGYIDHMYSNNGLYGLYGNVIDSGHAHGTFGYDSWKLGRGWYPVDGYKKTRSFNYGRGYSEEKADRLNELCRGPRSSEGLDSTTKQDAPVVESFPETLVNAKFFVIKSYSEDDVHNSIKYGMWSSTPTGNKKLNAAYQESSQECPVYLLFSVSMIRLFIQCSCGFIVDLVLLSRR